MGVLKSFTIVLVAMFFAASFSLPVWAFNPQPEPPGKPIYLQTNTPDNMKFAGTITKIEGNKITLKNQAGKLQTIEVKAQSQEDKQKLGGLQVGSNVKIEGGKLLLPQR